MIIGQLLRPLSQVLDFILKERKFFQARETLWARVSFLWNERRGGMVSLRLEGLAGLEYIIPGS